MAADGADKGSIFLLDIVFFKQINDNYGHSAGDNALRILAGEIADMVKGKGGFAGRWGRMGKRTGHALYGAVLYYRGGSALCIYGIALLIGSGVTALLPGLWKKAKVDGPV